MAITPVKTGNVPTPPPAKTTANNLTAKFNAVVKAGQSGPMKPVVPFYTPQNGRFVEDRKIAGNTFSTTVRWQINKDQGLASNRVNIKGTIVVDLGNYKASSYKLDPEKSFIKNDGSIHYTAIGLSNTPYKMKTNVFNLIYKKFESALEQVKNNKDYFEDSKGRDTPVSLKSGKLTSALNFVGERNLRYGVGLNGVAKRIKDKLNAELSNTNKEPNSVLIRKSIALAVRTAGIVPSTFKPNADVAPDADAAPNTLTPEQVRNLHVTLLPERTIDELRIANTPNDGVMNDDDIDDVFDATVAYYFNNDNANLRRERITQVADAYFDQLRMPHIITTNGIPEERRQVYRDVIFRVFDDNWNGNGNGEARQRLGFLLAIDNVPPNLRGPAEYLLTQSPIYNEERLRDHLEDLAVMINDNSETVSSIGSSNFNDDDDDATSTITSVSDLSDHSTMGLASRQWSFSGSSGS